jgi:hypothetical protein
MLKSPVPDFGTGIGFGVCDGLGELLGVACVVDGEGEPLPETPEVPEPPSIWAERSADEALASLSAWFPAAAEPLPRDLCQAA